MSAQDKVYPQINKMNILIYFLPVVLWLMLIITLPFVVNTGIARPIKHLDKVVHFFEFGILCFLITRAFYYSTDFKIVIIPILLGIGITIFFAAFDEFFQIYLPSRTASLNDFLADVAGMATFLVIFLFVRKKK